MPPLRLQVLVRAGLWQGLLWRCVDVFLRGRFDRWGASGDAFDSVVRLGDLAKSGEDGGRRGT